MILGAGAMAWADRAPQDRIADEAGIVDAFWLGVGQACALIPGVSRNGAALTAARFRRLRRRDASLLSRHVALPVIVGATALRAMRLRRTGLPPGAAGPLVAGALAAFASTFASTWVIRAIEQDVPLLPYSLYRLALASVVLRRTRKVRSRTMTS
jgi:undecaprenyl-diphosphatase